jgi:hypothetical protein
MLYGIVVSQTMFYFSRYPKDQPAFKLLVVSLLLLDTMSMIAATHGLYHYLIVNFGNLEVLQVQVWTVQVEPMIAYTIMLIVQAFFITRIWQLSGRKWIFPSILAFFSLSAFGAGVAIVVKVFTFKLWSSSLLPYMKVLVATNKALETAVDALITGALVYYLRRGRSGMQRTNSTNSMIDRLIVFAVNRGAITTFLQLCYLIAFEIRPDSMAWVALHIAISKVYTNSLLATLNSRNTIRGVGEDQEILSVRLIGSTLKFAAAGTEHSNELNTIKSSPTFAYPGKYGKKSVNSEATNVPLDIFIEQSRHASDGMHGDP